MIEILKSILLGIVEGITEWLPISSTGHMILLDEFVKLKMDKDFMEMFLVVIQLGAILAVVVLYFSKLWPFNKKRDDVSYFKNGNDKGAKKLVNNYVSMPKIMLWLKIAIASIPAAFFGILFDDEIDAMLTGDIRAFVVAAALIVYGVLFIVIESYNKKEKYKDVSEISFKLAFLIGLIQCLALVPGTSRSGSTILGAMLLGLSRVCAAEFSFFLSIPAMVGGSAIKLLGFFKDGNVIDFNEAMVLFFGTVTAFFVSVLAIKFLMSYIKKNDFKAFGVYRIVLGVVVILYFAFMA
ncbi:MAG: undecaprenyl-diphosphate phosphatase [Oscillospiraceae bacterium]|nr:undecaprenyl-diphosphate phosphatase [Oscillospiraceae bacterium]